MKKYVFKRSFAIRLSALILLCGMLISLSVYPANAAQSKSDYPYPELLEYEDLDKSFDKLAKGHILPEYRDYVLAAIKYHIESKRSVDYNSTDYRTAKNLLKAFNSTQDGNVVFFFDGCSINLKDTTPCFSGYIKNGKRYNNSAVCIVVRLNEEKHPEIVFATRNASTIPDNLRNKKDNNNINESITADGVYSITAVNHEGHILNMGAMDIAIAGQGSVRIPDFNDTTRGTYFDTATGIHLHSRYKEELYDPDIENRPPANSTGCFNVGKTKNDEDYKAFMKATTGIEDPESESGHFSYGRNTPLGYKLGSNLGILIVDHSNYKDRLPIIVGDDNKAAPNHKTGEEITAMITKRSEVWHQEILQYIEEHKGPQSNTDIIIMYDGSSSMSKSNYAMMKNAASAIVDEAIKCGFEGNFAIMPFARKYGIEKIEKNDDGFYKNQEDINKLIENSPKTRGGTFLADALQSLENTLDTRDSERKIIILMTDGNANCINDTSTKKYGTQGSYTMEINVFYNTALHLAQEKGYCFITLGVKIHRFPQGEEILSSIAEESNGYYQCLTSENDLDLSFVENLIVVK